MKNNLQAHNIKCTIFFSIRNTLDVDWEFLNDLRKSFYQHHVQRIPGADSTCRGLNCAPRPRSVSILTPDSVKLFLFGKRVFAKAIKLKISRSWCVNWAGPKSNSKGSHKKGEDTGESLCGVGPGVRVTLPQANERLEPPGEGGGWEAPLESSQGGVPLDTLISDPWPPELGENKFLLF